MKTLFVFVLGLALGAAALYYYQSQPGRQPAHELTAGNITTTARDAADRAVARTREATAEVSEALKRKMQEWDLTPERIKADLARGGEVAREKAARAKEQVSDARVVAVIKGKYVLDRELSANAITVESKDGRVTLRGTVSNEEEIAKAVALAMDTDGVTHVSSTLRVSR